SKSRSEAQPLHRVSSITDTSGSSQNAQIAAPAASSNAETMKGAAHHSARTKYPNTNGDIAPPMLPAMFIIPETVPEYLPPVSMGTAQAGQMLHSRKNAAPVKQATAT